MSKPVPSEEFLKAWQDGLVETARRNLRRDGEVVPFLFALTYADLVPESERRNLRPIEGAWTDVAGKDVFTVVVLPLLMHPNNLFGMILEYMLTPEKAEEARFMVAHAAEVARISEAEVRRRYVQMFLESFNMDEKDVLAATMRSVLKKVGAIAYVKLDDGYFKMATAPPGSSAEEEIKKHQETSMADDEEVPESIIAIMEHAGGSRMVALPYKRRRRNTGKVKHFGDIFVREQRREAAEGMKFDGRFTWMLDTAPAPSTEPLQ